jgi:anaerobic dimethyl sulfoxide reductase subunit C (anchor subunit)
MSEWPLIVFTLAIQLAAGLALATTLFDRAAVSPGGAVRPLGLAIFPLAAIGLLASMFHLGRPLSAWKSLLNLGQSRLSLEVLLTMLFVAAAFSYSYSWWMNRTEHRFMIGIVTSLLAAAAVASSASIYVLPTQPAWNSGWVPVSFFGTALVLGGSAASALVHLKGPRNLLGYALAGALAGSLLVVVAAIWMIWTLSHGSPDAFAAARLQEALALIISRYSVWFGMHLLLTGIVPIAFAALLWITRNHAASPGSSWVLLLFCLAVSSGAVIGRKLMYLLVIY